MSDPARDVVDAFKRLPEDDQARVYNELDAIWKKKANGDRLHDFEDRDTHHEC
jgi:hypothetical protein